MSVIAWSQTSIIRKGGLHTKRGSQIHARKKEAKKKVVRQASSRSKRNQRKR